MFKSKLQMEVTMPAPDLKEHKTHPQYSDRFTSHLFKHAVCVSPSGLFTSSLGLNMVFEVYFFKKTPGSVQKKSN